MDIENTSCYAFFLIQSAGYLDYYQGFIPYENSSFDPDIITNLLGIKPYKIMRFGTLKPNGKSRYNFSSWYGCMQTEPDISRFDQCKNIVNELKSHISVLNTIKEMYDVNYSIQIFPCSNYENCDKVIGFSSEIIEFCYLTNTEIIVDMALYSTD